MTPQLLPSDCLSRDNMHYPWFPGAMKMEVQVFNLVFITLLFVLSLRITSSDPVQADRRTINLDLPAEERWVEALKPYAKYAPIAIKALKTKIPPTVFPLAEKLATIIDKHFPEPYPDEMRGVAKAWNVSFADVILLNIAYDLTAYCTSIVAQDTKGNIVHGRNLDYQFSEMFRNLTFMVDFQRKG